MKTILLAAGAVALALTAGSTLAAKHSSKQSTVAGPAQPIPYGELSAYLKASPKERASKDWWAGANTGAGANASATAAATPSTAVNPPAAATPSPPAESTTTPK